MSKLLPDFPAGPLDRYRKLASFDWKCMKVFLETEEVIEHSAKVYEELQKHPLFCEKNYENVTFSEQRRITALRMLTIITFENLSMFTLMDNMLKLISTLETMIQLDPAMTIKTALSYFMFLGVIQNLGTERHLKYAQDILKGKIVGAYCLTEIGHGSNAKGMKTTATYDNNSKEFVLHSPNFEAAKCWTGNLGETATHAVVYAQLITPDGQNHSLHPFVVPLRDPKTFLPYPGLTIGDMGEKIGLNGIDNGYVIFNQYRIPRINLLNKTGDVTQDGVYVTPFRDPNKRYGASLGSLSTGRVAITQMSSAYMIQALTIALRYAGVRKQFGPEEDVEEIPVLEYQTHQHRLIPYLSVAYVLKIFSTYLQTVLLQFSLDVFTADDKESLADRGMELHVVSSATKPVSGWIIRDGIQECREACGGHGYLKISGIGEIKASHDANLTYEGENYVLIQQTSNWLLKFWPMLLQGQKISSPMKSIDFLNNYQEILNDKFEYINQEHFVSNEHIIGIYRWLVCYLLRISHKKYETLKAFQNITSFEAKNESQIYYLQDLAVVYVQHFIIQKTHDIMSTAPDGPIRDVLNRLLSLYALFSLRKHLATLYMGGYVQTPDFAAHHQNSILALCKSLKTDSIALIDAIAPPDFLIRSVLGKSDGLIYEHLEKALLQGMDTSGRPKWWKEMVALKKKLYSKL